MTTQQESLAVRPFRRDDVPACLSLLETCLAGGPTGRRDADFFSWKHLDNPFGESVILVAESGGQVVGLRAFMRWELGSGRRTVRAVRAVDTATHPEYQGLGIFRRLTLEAVDVAARDASLVFNTPNDQSRPGYLKMGWSVVDDLPVRIRPVRPLRFVRHARRSRTALPSRAAGRLASGTSPAADLMVLAGLDQLLGDVETARQRDPRLTTRRTPDYLAWRYAGPPGLDYRFVTVHDGAHLRGLAIGRMRARGALDEFTLAEVITRPGDTRAVRQLLRKVAHVGADHVATVVPSDSILLSNVRLSGFLRLPGSGLTMTARKLCSPDDLPDIGRRENWAMRLGDLELF